MERLKEEYTVKRDSAVEGGSFHKSPAGRNIRLSRGTITSGTLIPSHKYFLKNLTFVVRISTRVATPSIPVKRLRGQGEDQQLKSNVLPGLPDGKS